MPGAGHNQEWPGQDEGERAHVGLVREDHGPLVRGGVLRAGGRDPRRQRVHHYGQADAAGHRRLQAAAQALAHE